MYLITTLPMNEVTTFFSNKIKGRVHLRRVEHGYILRCEPTPAYFAWITHLHGSETLYIKETPVYIQLRSKI